MSLCFIKLYSSPQKSLTLHLVTLNSHLFKRDHLNLVKLRAVKGVINVFELEGEITTRLRTQLLAQFVESFCEWLTINLLEFITKITFIFHQSAQYILISCVKSYKILCSIRFSGEISGTSQESLSNKFRNTSQLLTWPTIMMHNKNDFNNRYM